MALAFQDYLEKVPSAARPIWVLLNTLIRYGGHNLGKVEKLDV